MSDPGLSYRTREEVQDIKTRRDPIAFVSHILIENKLATEDDLKVIDKLCKNEIDDAVELARKA